MLARRAPTRCRLVATLALAYALALQGLFGAMSGAAFAGEIRLANQLGVICTVHGPALPDGSKDPDPTPGRMACIEHCQLAAGMSAPAILPTAKRLAVERPKLAGMRERDPPGASLGILGERPPPQRGPPAA